MIEKSKKKGITLASLVVYVVLFTTFTVFLSNISGILNQRLFDNRGQAINYDSLNRLQYNMLNSAKKSEAAAVSANQIDYSNGDSYVYNAEDKTILKNGGILCTNVDTFSAASGEGTDNTKIELTVRFNKYLNVLEKTIISIVEEY